jgi:imidazole glycerol-phosphate synthase subunit HisF
MLRKRLITVLTFNDGVLFRTKKFTPDYRYTLNFVDAWSVDEIIVLDVTRPGLGSRQNFLRVIQELASRCFVPITAGGGVQGLDDFSILLDSGADKVSVNSEACRHPQFIKEAANRFGSQCVVVSIDAKKSSSKAYEVFSEQGRKATGMHPAQWAVQVQDLGAGEILVQSIDRDGSLEGYDNSLNQQVSSAVNIPVLACAGAGKWQDFVDGFEQGGASGVCTTNIYHFTDTSILSAKQYLTRAGIPMRL